MLLFFLNPKTNGLKILFTFFLIFPLILAKKYICHKDTLKNHICSIEYEVIGENSTYVAIQECKAGQECIEGEGGISFCQEKRRLGFESESCIYSKECYSGVCQESKCAPNKKPFDNCLRSTQCPWGYYCKNKLCLPPKNEKEECQDNFGCKLGLLCLKTKSKNSQGTCTKLFSIETGDYSNEDFLCKSGLMIDNICVEVKSTTSNNKCNSNEECKNEFLYHNTSKTKQGLCIQSIDESGYFCDDIRSVTQKKINEEILKSITAAEDEKRVYTNVPEKFFGLYDLEMKVKVFYSTEYQKSQSCVKDYFERLFGSQKNIYFSFFFFSLYLAML